MIFHALLLVGAAVGHVSARSGMPNLALQPNLFPLETSGGCSYQVLLAAVSSHCHGNCNAAAALLTLLPQVASVDALPVAVGQACARAWATVDRSSWRDVNFRLDDDFLQGFVDGDTFLNRETGNLKEDEVEQYPTSPLSRSVAMDIRGFYQGRLQESILEGFSALDGCAQQSILCCWGRDRQSNDDNGTCAPDDCDDASPADNSNLCLHVAESEGDIHCHGLAWSRDPNEASAIFKYNTFFYVSLYDHLYQRGYVENSLGGTRRTTGFPMCGCLDEMPRVSRADCTEVEADITFVIDVGENGELVVEAGGLQSLAFTACDGFVFGNPDKKAKNDLASHVNKLVSHGHVDVRTQATIFDVLVGFFDPDNHESEEACSLALLRQHTFASSARVARPVARGVARGKPTVEIMVSAGLCGVVVITVILGAAATKSSKFRKLLNLPV